MSDPLDFLAVDDLLGDDERAIRDTVRTFAESELLPDVAAQSKMPCRSSGRTPPPCLCWTRRSTS